MATNNLCLDNWIQCSTVDKCLREIGSDAAISVGINSGLSARLDRQQEPRDTDCDPDADQSSRGLALGWRRRRWSYVKADVCHRPFLSWCWQEQVMGTWGPATVQGLWILSGRAMWESHARRPFIPRWTRSTSSHLPLPSPPHGQQDTGGVQCSPSHAWISFHNWPCNGRLTLWTFQRLSMSDIPNDPSIYLNVLAFLETSLTRRRKSATNCGLFITQYM